jgi:hypothetical protein
MSGFISNPVIRATVTISCVLLFPGANSLALAQSFAPISPPAEAQSAAPQLLAPDQLDDLVAPIALYPDPLLGQALAASTYPLEIVEAQQWLQQNGNLQGQPLIEAARQQSWDPSVQLLVAFPDAMALLSRDIRWTTDLGNAFLAQQADVMNAIQRLRAQARDNGRLATTPQQVVTTETQDEQSAIRIQPANPQVIYPPVYNPAYVWGPPVSGAYPALAYPQSGYGSGFGSGINVGGLLSGVLSWGGWGWILGWFTHTLSLSSLLFNSFGSNNFAGAYHSAGAFSGPVAWAHNPVHRMGVPYPSGALTARYRGADPGARLSSSRFSGSSFGRNRFVASGRSASDGWRNFAGGRPAFPSSSSAAGRGFQPGNRMAESYNRAGAYRPGFASSMDRSSQNYRSYASRMPQQMASNFHSAAPYARSTEPRQSSQHFSSQAFSAQHFSAPHGSSSHFSSPHVSAPKGSSHFSAPRHSGGGKHSSKGSHKH